MSVAVIAASVGIALSAALSLAVQAAPFFPHGDGMPPIFLMAGTR